MPCYWNTEPTVIFCEKILRWDAESTPLRGLVPSYLGSCRVVGPQATASDDKFSLYGVMEKVEHAYKSWSNLSLFCWHNINWYWYSKKEGRQYNKQQFWCSTNFNVQRINYHARCIEIDIASYNNFGKARKNFSTSHYMMVYYALKLARGRYKLA